jgi:hypothetical protein
MEIFRFSATSIELALKRVQIFLIEKENELFGKQEILMRSLFTNKKFTWTEYIQFENFMLKKNNMSYEQNDSRMKISGRSASAEFCRFSFQSILARWTEQYSSNKITILILLQIVNT